MADFMLTMNKNAIMIVMSVILFVCVRVVPDLNRVAIYYTSSHQAMALFYWVVQHKPKSKPLTIYSFEF